MMTKTPAQSTATPRKGHGAKSSDQPIIKTKLQPSTAGACVVLAAPFCGGLAHPKRMANFSGKWSEQIYL